MEKERFVLRNDVLNIRNFAILSMLNFITHNEGTYHISDIQF